MILMIRPFTTDVPHMWTSDKFMQADLIGIGISKRLLYVRATLEDFSFQNCLHNNLVWLLNEPESVLPWISPSFTH